MQALAAMSFMFIFAVIALAAFQRVALRASDELAAVRAAAAADRDRHAQVMLELVAAVQAPGTHTPMLDNGPELSKLTIGEDDELAAHDEGLGEDIAEAVMAELRARESYEIPSEDGLDADRMRELLRAAGHEAPA